MTRLTTDEKEQARVHLEASGPQLSSFPTSIYLTHSVRGVGLRAD